jgi:ABC-type multidrug transport system permease subunit
VFATIQPVMFVLLFRYVFGGAIHVPGISYVDFLIPGIIVQTVVFGATSTAVGLSQDMSKGIIDRFRSLPMSRSAVLAGFLFIFPLVFASSVFVSIRSMPGWLQAFAKVQPITRAANAVRALTEGGPIFANLIWTVV